MDTDKLHNAAYHILPVYLATVVLKIGCMAKHVPIMTVRKIGMTNLDTISYSYIRERLFATVAFCSLLHV